MAATRGGTVTEYPRYKLVQDYFGFKVTVLKDVIAHAPGARPSAAKHNGQIDFQRSRTTVRHASLGSYGARIFRLRAALRSGMLSGTNAHQARFIFRRSARALRIWIWLAK